MSCACGYGSISAYRRTKPFSMRDADNTPQLILHTINQDDLVQFSQELQFLGRTSPTAA